MNAASERLRRFENVEVIGRHARPALSDASFDLVVLMHALTYAEKPAKAVAGRPACCARADACCSPVWRGTSTARWWSLRPRQPGFTERELRRFTEKAGLTIANCETVTRERRPPHFEVISLTGIKP